MAALSHLTVLDLSRVLAGPWASQMLADLGAEVIKIERPGKDGKGGDDTRHWGPPWLKDDQGRETSEAAYYLCANRNKRSVTVDFTRAEGQAIVRRLAAGADIVIENFKVGGLVRHGLDYASLSALNPRLVYCSISGFGQTGPYAARPGFATIAEVMSGLSAISGLPDGQPLLPPIALTDEVTGMAAAFATMVALHSGVGQVVDVSLLESLFQLMGPLISLYRLTGLEQERLGAGLPYSVPRGTYQCSDGKWVGLSTSSDSVAARVLRVLGVEGDPRFVTFAARMEHRSALEAVMSDWCRARPQAEVLRAFTDAQAAIGPVMTMADISTDPHYLAREAIVELDGTPMQGLLAKLSATPGALRWQGRAMGADERHIREKGWQ